MNIGSEVILQLVQDARERNVRPCIEAIPTYKGWLLGFESGRKDGKVCKHRTRKFKLPGGGIDPEQSPAEALEAEFREEAGVDLNLAWFGGVANLPVLAFGEMSTSRPEWDGKFRIITTLELSHTNFALNGEIVSPKRFCRIQDLLDQVGCCVHTSSEAADLYQRAIRGLQTDFGYLTRRAHA